MVSYRRTERTPQIHISIAAIDVAASLGPGRPRNNQNPTASSVAFVIQGVVQDADLVVIPPTTIRQRHKCRGCFRRRAYLGSEQAAVSSSIRLGVRVTDPVHFDWSCAGTMASAPAQVVGRLCKTSHLLRAVARHASQAAREFQPC